MPWNVACRRRRRPRPLTPHEEQARQIALLRLGRCVYCGGPGESLDHIIPRARGGKSTPDNMVAACLRCNRGKGSQSPDQFFRRNPAKALRFVRYARHAHPQLRQLADRHAASARRKELDSR